MQELKLTVTIEEANQILDALGNQPFKSVFNLIQKIQSQAAAQLQEQGSASQAMTPSKANTTINTLGANVNGEDPEK